MTDMTITACAPLPGQGLVARRGDLVIVTDGQSDGPDPLLGALEQTAGGDGTALVLAAARALLTYPGQSSGACAGVTAGGEVAVLVHGSARVTVAVDGEPEVVLTADGSMLPVHRTFTGSEVRAWLLSGGPAAPDDRLQLDGGVIYAAGLALEVTSATGGTGETPAGVQPAGQALAEPAGPPLAADPAAAASAELAPPAGQPAAEPAYADDDIVDAGSAADHQVADHQAADHQVADQLAADHRAAGHWAGDDLADAGGPAGDRGADDRADDAPAAGDAGSDDSDDSADAAAASEPPALAPDEQAGEPSPAAASPLTATMNDLPVSPEAAGIAAPDAGGQPETIPPFDVPPQTPAGVSGP
ncbi:MAG TPA: hypothetical protein VH478_15175, partial [Trebonia sp.]|nr:hypothetical protein [Trebonia sp.]